MAIGTATAILGSAVLGAGASLYGASQASKAAGKAADANAALQQQQYLQTRADLSPYAGAGNAATAALLQRLGLSSGASSGGAPAANSNTGGAQYLPGSMTPAGAQGFSTGDLAAIRRDWPGIEQAFNEARATADRNSPVFQEKGLDSLDNYTKYWYDNMRNPADYTFTPQAQQNRAPTQAQPSPDQPGTDPGQTDRANGVGMGQELQSMTRQEMTRPAASRPEFTEQQPDIGTGPMSEDYLQNFETSPGYQFRLDQGLQGVNNNFAARGLLKSGGALKGINDYAQGMASNEYGNWFNQQMSRLGADQGQFNTDRSTALAQYNQNRNVFNTNYNYDQARADNIFESDRARQDAIFESDRAYNANRYDAYTGNLFNLANMGQSAAAGQANAGQNYSAAATANNNALASVRGNAAIAGGNGVNTAIGNAVNAYGMYSNPFAGAGSGGFRVSPVGGWGF